VSLSPASSQTVTVDFTTVNNTAMGGPHCDFESPPDYLSTSGSLSFTPGITSRTITVPTCYRYSESARTFFVNLSNPINAALADYQGTGTIEQFID
jgi:hypothetical protein